MSSCKVSFSGSVELFYSYWMAGVAWWSHEVFFFFNSDITDHKIHL